MYTSLQNNVNIGLCDLNVQLKLIVQHAHFIVTVFYKSTEPKSNIPTVWISNKVVIKLNIDKTTMSSSKTL